MESSIYISSDKIEVIGYKKATKNKIVIEDYITAQLPEGIMINGKIIDEPALTGHLIALRNKKPELFKTSTLIVDGSSVFTKKIVVPKLNKQQYNQLIMDDFADTAENLEELVCDYHLINNTSGEPTAILACATNKSQIESYISTFKDAGIKLKAVRIGVQAILNYIDTRKDLQDSTFVLNVIDGVTMLSMIFVNGVNIYMSRIRLYGDDYEQIIQNIFENLARLIQFNKSEKFNDITHSYYLGLKNEDLELMTVINPHSEITIGKLNILNEVNGAEKLSPDAHFVYLNTRLNRNSIDLIRSRKTLVKLKKRQRPKKYWIAVLAGIAVIFAVPVIYLAVQTAEIDGSIRELNEYINSEIVVAKSAELDKIIENVAYYSDINRQLNVKLESENAKAAISNQILDLITRACIDKVTVNQFDFSENTETIRISGSSTTETDSAEYVDALKKSGLVKDIKYRGYNYSSTGEYNFSVDIKILKGEAAES